ncbi:MAG: hypothetical protein WC450_12555 [Candidatus Omnitrophota bacterium]|jgi:hypothetical protein
MKICVDILEPLFISVPTSGAYFIGPYPRFIEDEAVEDDRYYIVAGVGVVGNKGIMQRFWEEGVLLVWDLGVGEELEYPWEFTWAKQKKDGEK